MATLLTYALNTFPFPLQASPASGNAQIGTLTLVATNATDSSVSLAGLIVTIPVGPDGPDAAQYLTGSTAGINAVPPSGWPSATTNPGTGTMDYIFTPPASSAKLSTGDATQPSVKIAPGDSLTVSLTNISINATPGTVEIVVTEGSAKTPVKSFPVTKFPPEWTSSIDFEVHPDNINAGENTVLSWSGGPDDATYTIDYDGITIPAAGQPSLSNNGIYPGDKQPQLTLEKTTTFTLNVKMAMGGQTYTAQQQKQVAVKPALPVITSFTGDFSTSNNKLVLTLQWKTNAQRCVLTTGEGDLVVKVSDDNHEVQFSATNWLLNQYVLTAHNVTGAVKSILTVQWGFGNHVTLPAVADVALSPDQTRIYVLGSDGSLTTLNRANLQTISSASGFGTSPQAFALSPDGLRAYITDMDDNRVRTVDLSNLQPALLGDIEVGQWPMSIVATLDGKKCFVANRNDASISVLATSIDPKNPLGLSSTLQLTQLYDDIGMAMGLGISPDGKNVYAGGVWTGGGGGILLIIDAAQAVFTGSDEIFLQGQPSSPWSIAVTPDSSRVFIGEEDPVGVEAFATVGNPVNNLRPDGQYSSDQNDVSALRITPDGKALYVMTIGADGNSAGALAVLDIKTMKPIGSGLQKIGSLPLAMTVSDDGTSIYVVTDLDQTLWWLTPVSLA